MFNENYDTDYLHLFEDQCIIEEEEGIEDITFDPFHIIKFKEV